MANRLFIGACLVLGVGLLAFRELERFLDEINWGEVSWTEN